MLDTASQTVESRPRPRLNLGNAGPYSAGVGPWPVVATGSIASTGAAFSTTGVRTALSLQAKSTDDARVLATFDDPAGAPAAVAVRLGKGRLVRVAFALGLTYVENASMWERLPTRAEFPAAL
eukprot:SAG11_NODE_9790_length_880_cov_1.349552_1_plen_122_part_10